MNANFKKIWRTRHNKLHVPSKGKLLQVVQKKKECNGKAQHIVEQLLEEHIDEKWLLENLEFINKSHFQDVIEERSISGICGYPLCDKELGNVPKQTYKISTSVNKVYDLTKRKYYCSSLCYKSSKFLLDQLHTSPLWLRDGEHPGKFKLFSPYKKWLRNESNLTENVLDGCNGGQYSSNLNVTNDVTDLLKVQSTDNRDDAIKQENTNSLKETIDDLIPINLRESKFIKKSYHSYGLENNKNLANKVIDIFRDWLTLDSYLLLVGTKDVEFVTSIRNIKAMEEINKKLNIFDLKETDVHKPSCITPDYERLQRDAEHLQIKVKDFFSGNMSPLERIPPEDAYQRLPEIHHLDIKTTRRQLFLNQLLIILPTLLADLGLSELKLWPEIQLLVLTFKLSAHNINLRRPEWIIVTVVIIKLLTFRNKQLRDSYTAETTQLKLKYYYSLYDLTDDFFKELLSFLLSYK